MKRIVQSLLLFCLPLAVLADGMVVPSVAYPAKVTIPDQRALIHFTNNTERLVIETRFTGAGTNFAWIVPLPSQPVIEEATTGLFPTLQYLFRPQIVHDVTRFYILILVLIGLIFLIRFLIKYASPGFIIVLFFLLLIVVVVVFLPALGAASEGMASIGASQPVSILDRKLVGIYETTTISSHDPKALESWLRENGFTVATNAGPVIASYVKDGWVFVAAKIRRDQPENETNTPHPLSFTFKTAHPVYPMRLTGLDSPSLTVDLYVFGDGRATAPHFKVESCTRPNIIHPLLRQWVGDSPVATKLTATLSPAQMRQDVWLDQSSFFLEHKNRVFSRQGALTIALNWGAGFFAAGLLAVWLWVFASETSKFKLWRLTGVMTPVCVMLAGLIYFSLPKIDVTLVEGGYFHFYNEMKEQQLALRIALDDLDWHIVTDVAEARTNLRDITSNPTNAANYGLKNWENHFVGGQLREEDSPGNYLLRETNNQLELIFINREGGEELSTAKDLPGRH